MATLITYSQLLVKRNVKILVKSRTSSRIWRQKRLQ